MTKRFTTLLVITALLLSACGGTASTDSSTSAFSPGQGGTPPASGDEIRFDASATMAETVLVDESDVKITATGIEYKTHAVELSLTIENNSNQDLSFCSSTLGYNCNSVNGYMVDGGYLSADVAAGKKANETVSFRVDELTLLGISDIADIELGFSITDSKYDEYLQTGPRQLKTSIAGSYRYETDTYREAVTDRALCSTLGFTVEYDSEEVAYEEEGVRIVSQTLAVNSDGERSFLVEVENTSSDMVYVSLGDVSVNGLGIQSGSWCTDAVNAGKRRVIAMNLSSMLDQSYWSDLGLDKIGQIEYALEPKDDDLDALVASQQLMLTIPGGSASYDGSGEEIYQEDDLRIVYKGLVPDTYSFSNDLHLLLLVENGNSGRLCFDVERNSVSVNGYMTSFLCYSQTVGLDCGALLDVRLTDSSLEENGITGPEDIEEVELTVEVTNSKYKTIAKPVISITTAS